MSPAFDIHGLPQVNISNWKLAAKPFEKWGPRALPDTELIYIQNGRFELLTDEETVSVKGNDMLCIRPGEKHVFQCLEKSGTISCIHCDLPPETSIARSQPISDPDIVDTFRRCADVFRHPSPQRKRLLQVILTELLLRLPAGGPTPHTVSDRVSAMAHYIREHADEPISRSTLAKEFHVSPQHINYLFKQELGISPTALLHLERCKRAFQLIQNDRLSVKEAAERTGFCDAYHFSKVFKKTYGFPPGLITRFFKPQS